MTAKPNGEVLRGAPELPFREPGRELRSQLLRWRRIPGGLRYMRRHGFMALLRRIFPELRTYRAWVKLHDTIISYDRAAIARAIARICDPPLISVLMPVYDPPERFLREAIEAVCRQLYPNWELCIADDASQSRHVRAVLDEYGARDPRIKLCYRAENGGVAAAANSALALASGEFVALLDHDDMLPEQALYMIAAASVATPRLDLIFTDEDKIDAKGKRFDPFFKPDWNPDLMLSQNAVSRLAVYRRSLITGIGGFRQGFEGATKYDLVLRASAATVPERIRHIPHILYHRRARSGFGFGDRQPAGAIANACRAVAEHVRDTGLPAEVEPAATGFNRIRWKLPEPTPGVSIIVPTRDRIDLLRRCIDGLLHHTDYDDIDIVIVDNNSVEAESRAYFAAIAAMPGVRVLSYPGAYNYSAINNFAVRQARHDLVLLLNNDIEIIHPDWLREMASHAVRSKVGAVGAKLYYPNNRVQHAGTIVGLGGAAGHAFRYFRRGAPGYCGRLVVTQNFSAVTAACMLFRRQVFDEVGGLDEVNLPIAFNDVDLCLKMREKGYLIVWTPFAELYHWESVSRGNDHDPDKIERFTREMNYLKSRWSAVIANDPYYNPNLTIDGADFTLSFPPRVTFPWRPSPTVDQAS